MKVRSKIQDYLHKYVLYENIVYFTLNYDFVCDGQVMELYLERWPRQETTIFEEEIDKIKLLPENLLYFQKEEKHENI